MLATLAMRMLALQVDHGYDLRSGCLLVPDQEPTFELVDRLGGTRESWPVMALSTDDILVEAVGHGAAHGLDWSDGDLNLRASEAQLDLLRQSLEKADEEEQ
jgi:CRISPR-associated protein Csb1